MLTKELTQVPYRFVFILDQGQEMGRHLHRLVLVDGDRLRRGLWMRLLELHVVASQMGCVPIVLLLGEGLELVKGQLHRSAGGVRDGGDSPR